MVICRKDKVYHRLDQVKFVVVEKSLFWELILQSIALWEEGVH